MADPLRRLRLSFPAARPGVAMNGAVVAIVSAFFIIGITVGIIAVFALSARRADRRGNPVGPREHGPGGQPPEPGWDDTVSDDHTRWPGDIDNDFTGG